MSVALYDQALVDKVKSWIVDPNLVVTSPDDTAQLFSWKADISNDKPITLPLVALRRKPDITLSLKHLHARMHSGKTFNSNGKTSDHLNSIPITVEYQLDVYTRFRAEADEYIRNFVYNFMLYPKIVIDVPYNNSDLRQSSYIELDDTITDNSDIPERLITGQFTRYTINFKLIDAQLLSYNTVKVPKIKLESIESAKIAVNKSVDFDDSPKFDDVL